MILCSHRADHRATAQAEPPGHAGDRLAGQGRREKPPAVGLLDSVVMVVMLMRRNATQAAAAAHFQCSQPTVSRRWDLLRPVIGKVLTPYVPAPVQYSAATELPW